MAPLRAKSALMVVFTDDKMTATDAHGGTVALTSYGLSAQSIAFIGGELIGYTTGTDVPTSLTDSHIVFTASFPPVRERHLRLLPAAAAGQSGAAQRRQFDQLQTFDVRATSADGSTATGHFTVNVDAAGSVSTPPD